MAKVTVTEWKRPDDLSIPDRFRQEGYRYKWCRKDRLQFRLNEGWEIVPIKDGQLLKGNPDGVNMDNAYHMRELILCRMPEALAKQRDAYFRNKAEEPMKQIQRTAKAVINSSAGKANQASNNQRGTEGEEFTRAEGSVKVSTKASRNRQDGFGVEQENPENDETKDKVEEDLKALD